MKKLVVLLPLFFFLLPALVWASPPVPFSGKVAIDGVNFHGQAQFAFAIRDQAGAVHWRNGATANDTINVNVSNGRYVVLLGGQGMNPLPASLFANHDELYIKVSFDKGDGQGLVHLAPDQRITAVPYALAVAPSSIQPDQFSDRVLKYLKPEITLAPQAPGLIFGGQTVTLNSRAEGKFLTYQWYKNGQPVAGANKDKFVIRNVNASQHEGNYTLVVTNDFGSVTTEPTPLVVAGTPTTHTVESIGMEMIFCPPGTFTMGSPVSEANRTGWETQHQVILTNGFFLGKYEVTQVQYEAVMTGNPEGLNPKPSQWPGNPNRPVEKISWNDSQVFLALLNQMESQAGRLPEGWEYALPTEAEWEYACRAGTTTIFSWGNSASAGQANFDATQPYGGGTSGTFLGQTVEVGQYAPNPWGFFDMHGNVMEWCQDWLSAYPGGLVTNPLGPPSGQYRVARDATFEHEAARMRAARRGYVAPDSRHAAYGLRVGFKAIPHDPTEPEPEVFGGSSISVELNATVAMDMLWVSPGTFMMGSPTSEVGRGTDETEHNVTLTKGFYLGKYEVTQAQYEAVMTGNTNSLSPTPSQFSGNDRPVEKVSWDDAQVFLTRLNAQQAANLPAGWSYVLPTESQWEYACRAGTTTAYSWGNTIASSNTNYSSSGIGQTRDVGQYAANPWGFFDMQGNVWEWTADRYQAAYPTGNPVIDPTGPASGSYRVDRGGSWYYDGTLLRSAERLNTIPGYRSDNLGFRVGFQKQ